MQIKKIYILSAFILIFLFSTFISMRSQFWNNFIKNKVNEKLILSNWNFDFEKVSGFLLTTSYFENVKINNSSGINISIKRVSINGGILKTIFGKNTLDYLSLEGMNAQIVENKENLKNDLDFTKSLEIPFNIKTFFIKGTLSRFSNVTEQNFSFLIGGSFSKEERESFYCDIFKVSSIERPDLFCDFNDIIINQNSRIISLEKINGELFNLPVKGQVQFDKETSIIKGKIELVNFSFPDDIFDKLPIKNKFSSFKGKLDFESNLKYFSGNIVLENKLDLNANGNFLIVREENIWFLKNLKLKGEKSELTINGLLNKGEKVSCYMNLTNFDLSRWMNNQKETQLSGLLIVDASLANYTTLDQIDLTLEVIEEKLFHQGEISINGQIQYRDSLLSTIDPVLLIIEDSYLTIDGKGNFKTNEVDLKTDLERADIELVNNFLPGDFISGSATGKLEIKGNFKSPSANAELYCEDVKIDNFLLKSLELSSKIEIDNNLPSGFLDIKAGKGTWRDYSFESGTLNAIFEDENIFLENCHFKSGKDFFQASGSIHDFKNYTIDRLQIAYQNNYFVNSKSLKFSFIDSMITISPFEFHINDGMIEGVIEGDDITEGHFKMSNFDSSILTQFFKDNRLKISGLVFGEVWIKKNSTMTDLDIDISLKNGKYMEQDFDELTLSCLYKNKILHIDDISMTKKGLIGFQLNGIYPFNQKNKNRQPSISLKSNFSNLPLKFVHSFIPDFYPITGKVSGTLEVGGNHLNTNYNYNINVKNMLFDLVNLGDVLAVGNYDGKRLYIENTHSKTKVSDIKVNGSLPFDLNIASNKIGRFFNNDTLDLKVEANMKKLSFLSPYLTDLDSVKGQIDIKLALTGLPGNIQRDGEVFIKNGSIYTSLISDPIKSINGFAKINKNQLNITELKSLLYHPNSNYSEPKSTNTEITGNINLSDFFKPDYNLFIKAEEASYRLFFVDIVGQANLDLEISGKDTVEISGKIESLNANVFYEFSTEEIGSAINENQSIIMSYNLNIPIRSTAFFQNSQIDAEVIGEINLSQIGHQEIDFGGQIIVEDGNVFSYKDNFKNLQGLINFDNKGFNPDVDVSAFTYIDDERINLRINGGVEDLDIILESGSGFSESDILELLTWGKRFEDQEMTSTGFGNQTVSILGSLLENQLEKNLKESNIGMLNYVDDINISGAASLLQGAEEDFELTAKRKIGNKTYLNLSYKRSFSLNQDQSQIGVEYKLSRNFSVVGNMDKEGNLNLKYRYRYAY